MHYNQNNWTCCEKKCIYTNYEGNSALIRKTETTVKTLSYFDKSVLQEILEKNKNAQAMKGILKPTIQKLK